jgi:hypothetical protein
MYAADAAHPRDGDTLSAKCKLLGFGDPAEIAVER